MSDKTRDDIFEVESTGGQTSNKEGKHSSAQKPSNSGPDAHQKHKTGPVPGAFGKDEGVATPAERKKGGTEHNRE